MPRSAIEEAIIQADADAEAHKRIARQNRDQAARKLRLRDQLLAFCREHDIPVEFVPRKEQR